MALPVRGLATALLLTTVLAACAQDEPTPEEPTMSPSSSDASPATDPEPEYLPAGDLPDALTLDEVGGRTITAKPFADFAVGSGSGVWVSGVGPGIVRYDGASGAITARTPIAGDVAQALEATRTEVLVPSLNPSALFRLDATTGAVRDRVKLPAQPTGRERRRGDRRHGVRPGRTHRAYDRRHHRRPCRRGA